MKEMIGDFSPGFVSSRLQLHVVDPDHVALHGFQVRAFDREGELVLACG